MLCDLPRTIKLGPIDYDVTYKPKLKLFGRTNERQTRIELGPQSATSARDTLLHEALHALIMSSGAHKILDFDLEGEERVVRILTPWLLGLIRDNPELVDYLRASES